MLTSYPIIFLKKKQFLNFKIKSNIWKIGSIQHSR